jgi:hypothetical protein
MAFSLSSHFVEVLVENPVNLGSCLGRVMNRGVPFLQVQNALGLTGTRSSSWHDAVVQGNRWQYAGFADDAV